MKITSKRMFSCLIVLAVVLAVAPVMSLPASAAETEAIRFPSGVASYDALCPVCKKTVTWTPYNGENDSGNPLRAPVCIFTCILTRTKFMKQRKNFWSATDPFALT